MGFPPAEHAEYLSGVNGHVQRFVGVLAVARRIGYSDLHHFVHAEMLDLPDGGIVGHHVIIFVVPGQGEGADFVKGPVVAEVALLGDGVVEIAEADLPVLGNAAVDLVHIIVNGFVHGFDPVLHEHLPPQQLRFIAAGQIFDLFDERERLFVGDELGGLHAVHQQFQLRQFKVAAAHIVAVAATVLHGENVYAELAQRVQIVVQTLALGGNALLVQMGDDLLDGQGVRLVGFAQQIAHHIKQFQLLVCISGHGGSLLLGGFASAVSLR